MINFRRAKMDLTGATAKDDGRKRQIVRLHSALRRVGRRRRRKRIDWTRVEGGDGGEYKVV